MLTFLYDGVEEGKLAESALRGYLIGIFLTDKILGHQEPITLRACTKFLHTPYFSTATILETEDTCAVTCGLLFFP